MASTATQHTQAAPQGAALPDDPGQLLDLVLSRTAPPQRLALAETALDRVFAQMAVNDRYRVVRGELEKRIELVEALLPRWLKGEGDRLVQQALMTLTRKQELTGCPPVSFIRAVVDAAQMGLAIDGRMAHVVPFKGNWQLLVDYKGVIAVARRSGVIRDAQADVVCENDQFRHGRVNGQSVLEHTFDPKADRGKVVAAYCVIRYGPDASDWKYELMERAELDRIRGRSAAAQKGFSPWSSDEREMQKKTVIRRALKTHTEDPGIARLLDTLDRQDALDDQARGEEHRAAAARTLADLKERFARPEPANGLSDEPPAAEEARAPDPTPRPRRRRPRAADEPGGKTPAAEEQAAEEQAPAPPPAGREPGVEPDVAELPEITGRQLARIAELRAAGPFAQHCVAKFLKERFLVDVKELKAPEGDELVALLEARIATTGGG